MFGKWQNGQLYSVVNEDEGASFKKMVFDIKRIICVLSWFHSAASETSLCNKKLKIIWEKMQEIFYVLFDVYILM